MEGVRVKRGREGERGRGHGGNVGPGICVHFALALLNFILFHYLFAYDKTTSFTPSSSSVACPCAHQNPKHNQLLFNFRKVGDK